MADDFGDRASAIGDLCVQDSGEFHDVGLLQERIVEAYTSIEAERLLFVVKGQRGLRAELYQGLVCCEGISGSPEENGLDTCPGAALGVSSASFPVTVDSSPAWARLVQPCPYFIASGSALSLRMVMAGFIDPVPFGLVVAGFFALDFHRPSLTRANISLFSPIGEASADARKALRCIPREIYASLFEHTPGLRPVPLFFRRPLAGFAQSACEDKEPSPMSPPCISLSLHSTEMCKSVAE